MIMDEREFFTYSEGPGKGSPAAFANLFRYKLLFENGGWWVDTDVICLSSHIPVYDRFFALQEAAVVNNAILYFERYDPVMLRSFEEAKRAGKKIRWGETGPSLLTRVIGQLGLLRLAQESRVCYPLSYQEALDILRPGMFDRISKRTERSFFLHLWNEIIRRHQISKRCLPPRGSWLRSLIERYGIEDWEGEYTVETLENSIAQQIELDRIIGSRSWRITAPLRTVGRLLHRNRAVKENCAKQLDSAPLDEHASSPAQFNLGSANDL
jgi:hypothetical protein